MSPFNEDITSCNDPYPKFRTLYTEVSAKVFVRNDDVAPFDITVKIKDAPSIEEAIRFIEDLLFELG